jgi:hypothetical protein
VFDIRGLAYRDKFLGIVKPGETQFHAERAFTQPNILDLLSHQPARKDFKAILC